MPVLSYGAKVVLIAAVPKAPLESDNYTGNTSAQADLFRLASRAT